MSTEETLDEKVLEAAYSSMPEKVTDVIKKMELDEGGRKRANILVVQAYLDKEWGRLNKEWVVESDKITFAERMNTILADYFREKKEGDFNAEDMLKKALVPRNLLVVVQDRLWKLVGKTDGGQKEKIEEGEDYVEPKEDDLPELRKAVRGWLEDVWKQREINQDTLGAHLRSMTMIEDSVGGVEGKMSYSELSNERMNQLIEGAVKAFERFFVEQGLSQYITRNKIIKDYRDSSLSAIRNIIKVIVVDESTNWLIEKGEPESVVGADEEKWRLVRTKDKLCESLSLYRLSHDPERLSKIRDIVETYVRYKKD